MTQHNWPAEAETEKESERRIAHLPSPMVAIGEIKLALKLVIEDIPTEELQKSPFEPRRLVAALVGVWAAAEARALKLSPEHAGKKVRDRAQEIFDLFELMVYFYSLAHKGEKTDVKTWIQ